MRAVQAADPVERFAADRHRFERLILRRFGSTLTAEDAEDIVSEALIGSAVRCPEGALEGGSSWFARVVLNKAEDYRRARDGRPRCARSGGSGGSGEGAGTSRRFVPLEEALEAGLLAADELTVGERLEQEVARNDTQATVRKALATLESQQAAVLKLRHLGERASRRAIAEELGISLWQYESLYTSARRAFAGALAEAAPTEQCVAIRKALADGDEDSHARRFADAHVAACCSCAAFARRPAPRRTRAVAA